MTSKRGEQRRAATDPRRASAYVITRRKWRRTLPPVAVCIICGGPVDTRLSGNDPWGPTVEHRVPVRHIIRTSATLAEAIARACDTSSWDVAHRRCQSFQGGRAILAMLDKADPATARTAPRPSRDW